MPGWSNADNRFGPSSFVVGHQLGNGVNYTSINAALTDALAVGATAILIRGGVNYTEDLIIQPGIDLIGVAADGRAGLVSVVGNHTYTGGGKVGFYNMAFIALSGDLFTFTVSGQNIQLFADNCLFESGLNSGFVCNSGPGDQIDVSLTNCTMNVVDYAFDVSGSGSALITGINCSINGATIFGINSPTTVNYADSYSTSSAVFADISDATSFISLVGGVQTCDNVGLLFNAAATAALQNCAINCNAGSGFFAEGPAGTIYICGVVNSGSANGIDSSLTTNFFDWKPYAEAGASPGTGLVRGTSSYDNTQFSVSDGFVQVSGTVPLSFPTDSGTTVPSGNAVLVLGGPGVTTQSAGNRIIINSVIYEPVAVNTLATSDTGYFTDGSITLTLPVAPSRADLIEITAQTAGVIVTASAGQIIRIGNSDSSVAGTATSTDVGDSLILRYNDSNQAWSAMSSIGNWVLA